MNKLELELKNLSDNLSDTETRTELLNQCVYDRLSDLLVVQASYFDDSLSAINSALNLMDFTDHRNLRQFNVLCKNLYHFMGIDRHRMINYMIQVKNL